MGLNDTPNANRIHIAFFGARNAGKSSLVNAVTNQNLSIVSDTKGTTTDPVLKSMELLPLGPVTIIDTPGFDDTGELGELRVQKTKQILNKTDIAVLAVDARLGISETDTELISLFKEKQIPYCVAYNKSDLLDHLQPLEKDALYTSAVNLTGIEELKEKIISLKTDEEEKRIIGDKINPGDFILLIVPIDSAAPKGRLILPQQQTIRDILDSGATAIVTNENEIEATLSALNRKPALAICDSQVFKLADASIPKDIPLTSFSILMARYKGFLDEAVKGATMLKNLCVGDRVVISEGCTHHRQCADIGTVKIPKMLNMYTEGKKLDLKFTSGGEFYDDLSGVKLVIHCGGCMLNEREISYRMKRAQDVGVAFTNYGIAIACMQGILKRSIEIFPDLHKLL